MTAAQSNGHPCAVDLHRTTCRAASRPALPSKLRRMARLIAALAGVSALAPLSAQLPTDSARVRIALDSTRVSRAIERVRAAARA